MNRRLAAAACLIAAGLYQPGFAVPPPADLPSHPRFTPVQDTQHPEIATLDAQLEVAAVTAQLIRSYSALLTMTQQFLDLMAAMRQLLPQEADSSSQQHARDVTLQKAAQIRDARDTALEAYLRLIAEIDSTYSIDAITARVSAVDKAMDMRGEGSIKTALPAILLHIHLVHEHAAPSREAVLNDITALPSR